VATLFPSNRTHYLNILHASWPAGLVLGGLVGWVLGEKFLWGWKAQLSLFLVPTAVYGLMFFGQHMPKSEASQKGLKLGEMFKDVGILGALVACFLLALFFSGVLAPLLTPDNADTAAIDSARRTAPPSATSSPAFYFSRWLG
jgi:MFS family permease